MAEPETEKKTLSVMLDSDSIFVSISKDCNQRANFVHATGWSLLPGELLHIISTHLKDCFDVVHARSVCLSWRSTFPFPASLSSPSYRLPSYADFPLQIKDLWTTLEKIPLFLFRVMISPGASAAAPGYLCFLGGLGQDVSEDHMELLPSPLQCSVKVKIPGFFPAFRNMLDCEIVPLGHQYRMIGWELRDYRGLVFLPLNKEGRRGEFVVLLSYTKFLLVLTSAEMRWKQLKNVPGASFSNLIAFRGRFYVAFRYREVVVIDPCSLDVTPLMPSEPEPLNTINYLVPSGDDELFLVELIIPTFGESQDHRLTCRVSRLDEEAGRWVAVSDLGDRVLFIGFFGNVSCLAKDLPDGGCGVTGNSVLFTNGEGNVTHSYKYVAGSAEDGFSYWRLSRENRVRIVNKTPVAALRFER